MILTMARRDEKMNLETLVRVFGESELLQELANRVMIMGTPDDLRTMSKGQQEIVNNVLHAMDRYDLYGTLTTPHCSCVPIRWRRRGRC